MSDAMKRCPNCDAVGHVSVPGPGIRCGVCGGTGYLVATPTPEDEAAEHLECMHRMQRTTPTDGMLGGDPPFYSHDWRTVPPSTPGSAAAECAACGCRHVDRAARLPCRGGQVYGPDPDLTQLSDEELRTELYARHEAMDASVERYYATLQEEARRA